MAPPSRQDGATRPRFRRENISTDGNHARRPPSISPDGVDMPGANGIPISRAARSVDGLQPGATATALPRPAPSELGARFSTVPAPINVSGSSARIRRIASTARGVRKVSSIAVTPPAASARPSGTASLGSSTVSTAITPVALICPSNFSGNIAEEKKASNSAASPHALPSGAARRNRGFGGKRVDGCLAPGS